jgi:hypothetical protein
VSDIDLESLTGLGGVVAGLGLAAFFVFAALVSFVALRWRRNPRWRPPIATSLLYAAASLIATFVPKSRALDQHLDDTCQIWALGVVGSWLLLNVWLGLRRRRADRLG